MAVLTNVPEKVDLEIAQGTDFSLTLIIKTNGNLVDLTGYTGKLQIRSSVKSTSVLYEMSASNGKLIFGGTLGTINISLPNADSTLFDWRTAVYDLEITDTQGKVYRILQGTVLINKEVTR